MIGSTAVTNAAKPAAGAALNPIHPAAGCEPNRIGRNDCATFGKMNGRKVRRSGKLVRLFRLYDDIGDDFAWGVAVTYRKVL